MIKEPLVSIICLTYNEEKFVRDTIDNFLSQEVNFTYEILVYDDASEDKTPDILREYADKHPNLFHMTLYKENNFKKGLGFLGLREGFRTARGKYIAYCEGDDYWCDDYKLQKQVDFLESHAEYSVCAHETRIRNDYDKAEDGTLFTHTNVNIFLNRKKRDIYTFNDALTGNIFHISSMMFRNDSRIKWPEWICDIKALDMILFMILAERGDIFLMRDVMSVYRHNKYSITSTDIQFANQILFNNISLDIVKRMDEYWKYKYHDDIVKVISRYYMSNMFCYLGKGNRDVSKAKEMASLAFSHSKVNFVKYLFVESYAKIRKHF